LTPKELAVSYDLPVALHKEWRSASKDLPFLGATPSKILMSVSEAVSSSLALVARERAESSFTKVLGELPPSLPPGPVTQAGVAVKAAKADDAEAEVALWDAEFVALFPKLKDLPTEKLAKSCEGLRNGGMRWWKKSITMEVQEYPYLKYGLNWKTTMSKEDKELGRDI
jgi:hypothetical protein